MKHFLRNLLLALCLCSLVSLAALARFDFTLTGIDDANIYFVYARNLADGYGFVYNVGGERVAGFTSLLWTLICALAFRWSAHPEAVLLIVSVFLLSLGTALSLTYLQTRFPAQRGNPREGLLYSILFLALVLTSPRYIVWNTMTLMDNGLWSTVLLAGALFVVQDHGSARAINTGFALLSIVLVLTRPEAPLWAGLFLAVLFLRRTSQTGALKAVRDLAPSILCLAAAMAGMLLFQLAYFGYPLPNTFYAKVSPSLGYNLRQGAAYLGKYMVSDPVVLLAVLSAIFSSFHTVNQIIRKRAAGHGASFLPLLAAAGLLAPLLTGGDHFGSFRLYQNIYPILVLALLYSVNLLLPFLPRLPDALRRKQSAAAVPALGLAAVFLIFQLQPWQSIHEEMNVEFLTADYGRKNGAFIQQLFSPLSEMPSLGVVTSGGIKYSYAGPIVDLMGLNNTLMAHNHGDRRGIKNHAAFDIPTFYQLQPDIVWPRTVLAESWQYHQQDIQQSWENREGLDGLFDDPRFLEMYIYARVSHDNPERYALVGWFKKDLLEELKSSPDFDIQHYPYIP